MEGLRIKFLDKGNIVNQELIIDKPRFTVPYLSYEKVFERNGKDVVEEYSNGEMHTYFETERSTGLKITRGYSPEGKMFCTNVTYYNSKGKPMLIYQEVRTMEGTLDKGYRYYDQNGYQSWDGFKDFESCYKAYLECQKTAR